MSVQPTILYVCPHCFTPDTVPGPCSVCGHTRVECDLGDPENPCRKPPMDQEGRILSRAPLWWLACSVPYLRENLKRPARQSSR